MAIGPIDVAAVPPFPRDGASDVAEFSDEDLLTRFLSGREELGQAEAAFEAVVRRHGALVLGVCRQILRDPHEAEDAFQATFLVLALNAHKIRKRESLSEWLHGVAYRTASKARAQAARRRAREGQGSEMSATDHTDDLTWSDLKPVLHEEIHRLPGNYRSTVILCYLDGKTTEEAAQVLQCPVGTVKARLSRAREILRKRLTRRGVTLSAALLATFLGSGTTVPASTLPVALIEATVRTGMLAGTTSACASAFAAARLSTESSRVLAALSETRNAFAIAADSWPVRLGITLKHAKLFVGALLAAFLLGGTWVASQAWFDASVKADTIRLPNKWKVGRHSPSTKGAADNTDVIGIAPDMLGRCKKD